MEGMEIRKFTKISLFGQMLNTLNFYIFVNRGYAYFNIDDFTYVAVSGFLFSNFAMVNMQIMPTMALLMTVIPSNIEASMFSVVSASLGLNLLWGGQLSATIVYQILGITSDDLS